MLTPASIREQWAGELRDRFGLRPAVFDQPRLAIAGATLPPGVNPWITERLIISSIDLVKRPEVRAALESVRSMCSSLMKRTTSPSAPIERRSSRSSRDAYTMGRARHGNTGMMGSRVVLPLQQLGDVGTDSLRTFRRSRQTRLTTSTRRSRLLFYGLRRRNVPSSMPRANTRGP